jgi:acyl carrier protein
MLNRNIFEQLKFIFVDILRCDESDINENSSSENLDQWDSLAHIKLILEIERQFVIKFSLGELQNLKSIKDLVVLVETKL